MALSFPSTLYTAEHREHPAQTRMYPTSLVRPRSLTASLLQCFAPPVYARDATVRILVDKQDDGLATEMCVRSHTPMITSAHSARPAILASHCVDRAQLAHSPPLLVLFVGLRLGLLWDYDTADVLALRPPHTTSTSRKALADQTSRSGINTVTLTTTCCAILSARARHHFEARSETFGAPRLPGV